MNKKRQIIQNTYDYGILSAIWILASNDENPMITYKGIKYRLGLSEDYDVVKLISSHGELFRKGVPINRLRDWKTDMQAGKHLPSWIRDMDDEAKRSSEISKLTSDDVFRSQFRAERYAEKSQIEIIDWGLQHIDRLRKASLVDKEQNAKRWEIWLVFAIGVINIALAIFLR